MRAKRAVGIGIVLAALAAGTAQGAELSVTQRLEDRREVAAGTRAQVLGFEDGRFYANGWHITGEMGGIVTPPLKLLDSVYFGVNDQWVGPATRFTSGWGYVRYDAAVDRRRRPAPHGRRARRPARGAARARADEPEEEPQARQRDGRRPLRADDAIPVGLRRHDPERERQRPRQRRRSKAAGSSSATPGGCRARRANHSYTAIVGSNRDAGERRDRPRPLRAVRRGPRLHRHHRDGADAERVRRRPVRPRHGREAALPGRRPRQRLDDDLDRRRRLGELAGRGAQRVRRAHGRPRCPAGGEARQARGAVALVEARAAGQRAAGEVGRLGQAEPGRPDAAGRGPRDPLDERGQAVAVRGRRGEDRLGRRRLPGLPVAVRRRRRVHRARQRHARAVRPDQGPHARGPRSLRRPQRRFRGGRARGRRRRIGVARQGHVHAGRQRQARPGLQHGRDRQVPGRRGADLALDGRRRLPRRHARLHEAQPRLRAGQPRRGRRRLA